MTRPSKLHLRDLRLYVNAGISVASCVAARTGPLDVDRALATTGTWADVTCANCRKSYAKRYPWTGRRA